MTESHDIGTTYDDSLRRPSYANGRLLSAEDLQADQEATLKRLAALGEGVGAGIVRGLMVEKVDATRVKIAQGLGINRRGVVLRLTQPSVTLAVNVAPEDEDSPAPGAGSFGDCTTAPSSGPVVSQEGAYLLVVRPTSRLEGRVPVKSTNGSSDCASQWSVEGLRFRVIRLGNFPVQPQESRHFTRSRLAHWCYGSAALRALVLYPFAFNSPYNGLDQLPDDVLTPCDLPLAVFYWDANGISFVDNWSARRRITHAFPYFVWKAMVSDQRAAEGEARFFQFGEQLAALNNRAEVHALGTFAYLPPVGFIPIRPSQALVARMVIAFVDALFERMPNLPISRQQMIVLVSQWMNSALKGNPWGDVFDLETFFQGVTVEHTWLTTRYPIEQRLNTSWFEQPISLAQQPTVDLFIPLDDLLLALIAGVLQNLTAPVASEIGLTVEAAQPAGTVAQPVGEVVADIGRVRQPFARRAAGSLGRLGRERLTFLEREPLAVHEASPFELAWGLTDASTVWKQPEPLIAQPPEDEGLRVAWTNVVGAASDVLRLAPEVVTKAVYQYNVVRMYAMFVQAESNVISMDVGPVGTIVDG